MPETLHPRRPMAHAGFTVIELMVVLAIAALILALALPAYRGLGNSSRSQAYASALVRDVQLARSTAITSGAPVTLCAAASANTCAANAESWLGGWVIYRGITFNAATSTIVSAAVANPNTGGDAFVSTLPADAPSLTFNRQGHAPAAGVGVRFTFDAGATSSARQCVVVTAVGAATRYAAGAATPTGVC